MKKYKIAVLDDYQNVALRAPIGRCSAIERTSPYFRTTLPIRDALIERLLPFGCRLCHARAVPAARNRH